MAEVFSILLALVGVIALMLGSIYLMKWLTRRFNVTGGGKGIEVTSCVGVGQDKSVMAVKAGNKNLLLGVTSAGINVLCELSDEDMAVISSRNNNKS